MVAFIRQFHSHLYDEEVTKLTLAGVQRPHGTTLITHHLQKLIGGTELEKCFD